MITFRAVLLSAVAAASLQAMPAFAQSRQVLTPNISTAAGAVSATLNGNTFVNQGLLGAGRISATTLDFRGETFGSFSGMAIDLKTWRRNADGSYSGGIYTLPDRGPFDGAIDYRNRVHTSNVTFRPLAPGSAALPQSTASQSQVTITPTGGFTLKDTNGVEMTGRDPGASTVTRNGIVYPLATDGTAAGRIALDAEAIAFRPDGTFYISDEYADGIYYFDASGKQIGAIQTVAAMLPRTGGTINFNSVTPGQTGRRNNQGLEAMALTPDNKKLVAIQQSATVQDTNGANQQTRNNTRILVYDISGNATPTNPIGHYVLQLPVFNNNGTGAAADRTAAQSEMLALNDTQFLVLARDGVGRGVAANASTSTTPLFKSILLVDTTGATNLAGTAFETTNAPIATNGTLNASITPVQQVELINLVNPTQLARVGMNITRLPVSTPTTISEKIEAMALAPVLEEGAPQDFFLFVGNDNDFQGSTICFNGVCSPSGALDGTGNNDSVLMVYRLTLPTYVDPLALASMIDSAPRALTGLRSAAAEVGLAGVEPAMGQLGSLRRALGDYGQGVRMWLGGQWSRFNAAPAGFGTVNAKTEGLSGGVDVGVGPARIGASISYRNAYGAVGRGNRLNGDGYAVGLYGGVALPNGLYAEIAGSRSFNVDFDRIDRATAYDQTARGKTGARVWAGSGELGWMFGMGAVKVGPFAGVDYVDVKVDAFTETGASLANVAYADLDYRRWRGRAGGEVRATVAESFVINARAGYMTEDEKGDRSATVRLASARHSMGSQTVVLPDTTRDRVFAGGGFGGSAMDGAWTYQVAVEGRFDQGPDEGRISLNVSRRF
ncbi:esterase-like activity of phytase family protein [Sphingomonas montanisoli]|nr:esterase-like activity of phytase family protein [Sphingomonas montanisoli]